MDVAGWLHSLGLGMYAKAFADNAVDAATLHRLTDADLRELGVAALGHRKKLLAAIAELASGQAPLPSCASGVGPLKAPSRGTIFVLRDQRSRRPPAREDAS